MYNVSKQTNKQTNKHANKQEINYLYIHAQQICVSNILLDVNIVNLEFINVLKGTPSKCNMYLITTTSPVFRSAAVN